jgi:hypothetical protein
MSDDDLTGVESAMSASGFRLVVYEADGEQRAEGSWTWRLDTLDATRTAARAGSFFETEKTARSHAEQFNDALPVAVGSGTVFEVVRVEDGWGWRLTDGESTHAVAPSVLSDEKGARENVGRVKAVAGTATVGETGSEGVVDLREVEGETDGIVVSVDVEERRKD